MPAVYAPAVQEASIALRVAARPLSPEFNPTCGAKLTGTERGAANADRPRFQKEALRERKLATLMGLEPTTSAVTGRRSNQLSYNVKRRSRPFSRCSAFPAPGLREKTLAFGASPRLRTRATPDAVRTPRTEGPGTRDVGDALA